MALLNLVNCRFLEIDFLGKAINLCSFENSNFNSLSFRKCQFTGCTFKNCQLTNVDLTRAEFDSCSFTNCSFLKVDLTASDFTRCKFKKTTFLESNLTLILIEDVKVWKSNEWIELKVFSERRFHLLATFPFVHVHQDSGFWKAEIYCNSELYTYQYPFSFPKSYLSYQDKYDMQVKLQIIKSFANTTLQKEFRVLEFLQKFRSTPNTIKAHIKDLILNAFQALLQEKLIRKQITLQIVGNKRKNKPQLRKTLQIELTQLTPLLIGKTETLFYLEII